MSDENTSHEAVPAVVGVPDGDVREQIADRLARAFDGNGGDDLGAAQGEGALHLALVFPIKETIEDVYADCGDSDPRVLSTNIAQRLAWLLPPAILAAFPELARAGEMRAETERLRAERDRARSDAAWIANMDRQGGA